MKTAIGDLARALAPLVPHDRLVLHVPGQRLEAVRGDAPAAATCLVPLSIDGAPVGRLHVSRATPFAQVERERLASLAPLLAVSVRSILEIDARRRLLDEAGALLEIGRATAMMLDPRELVMRALAVVSRHVPAPTQFCVFGELGDDRTEWGLLGIQTPDPSKAAALRALTLRRDGLGPMIAAAVRSGEAVVVPEVQREPGAAGELARRFGFRTLLAVPLRTCADTAGVLFVCHPSAGWRFSEPELLLLRGVADQIAISLRNAGLARENLRTLADLRRLSRRTWQAQEEERERIARELHDEAGQALTALKLHLDLARREADPVRVHGRIAEAVELAGTVLDALRRISRELRPGALHELGLVPALRALVDEFGLRSGVEAEFECTTGVLPHPAGDAASAAFRFVQEALSNVARHAQARKVSVRVDSVAEGMMRVTVADDGVGFLAGAASDDGHLGLLAMRERARTLGGWVTIDTAAGRGTRLVLELPERGAGT